MAPSGPAGPSKPAGPSGPAGPGIPGAKNLAIINFQKFHKIILSYVYKNYIYKKGVLPVFALKNLSCYTHKIVL
jgi:hypothetical protein